MDTLNVSNQKTRRSPSPSKTHGDYQPQVKKSMALNESELDSKMTHWEEYKVKGLKISRRSYHSAVFHGQSLYIYGGYEINAGILSDFIKVDLTSERTTYEWEEVASKSKVKPGPRCRHSAIVYQNKLYLYGGQINSVENTNKIMVFDFTSHEWSDLQPKKQDPVPLIDSHTALLWEQENGKASMIVVGGFLGGKDGGYSNAVYEYDFAENQWNILFKNKEVDNTSNENPSVPQGRMSLGATIYKNALYVFGGNEGHTKLNDLWKFDLNEKKWNPIKPEGQVIPEPRSGHTLVCYKDILILFGGILDIAHEKNDIFAFKINKNQWSVVEKDTKWIFEEQSGFMSSPAKRASGGLENSKSPHKKNMYSSKQVALGKTNYSGTGSDEGSPTSLNKTGKSGFDVQSSMQKSPSKYSKLKLLESLPKGVPPAREGNEEDDQSNARQKMISQYSSSIEEKAQRDKLMKKMMMLKEFEVDEEKAKDLNVITPVLEAMQKSIDSLGLQEKSQENQEQALWNTMAGLEALRAAADKTTDDGKSIKTGVKPVARDGHSATILEDKMFIFAGDRHKMSFNDLFALNLKFFESSKF